MAENGNHRISVFSLDGNFVRWIGVEGSGNCRLREPCGMCCVDDLLIVADRGKNRVCVFDFDGSFKWSFQRKTDNGRRMRAPCSVCFSCDLLYVTEYAGHCVSVWRLDGSFVSVAKFSRTRRALWSSVTGCMSLILDVGQHVFQCLKFNNNQEELITILSLAVIT